MLSPPIHSYHVFDIGDPYVSYTINVTVQQMDFRTIAGGTTWSTVGYAEIGPERLGDNTDRNNLGTSSGPKVHNSTVIMFVISKYGFSVLSV